MATYFSAGSVKEWAGNAPIAAATLTTADFDVVYNATGALVTIDYTDIKGNLVEDFPLQPGPNAIAGVNVPVSSPHGANQIWLGKIGI